MADVKWSAVAAVTATADADEMLIIDATDASSKRQTKANFLQDHAKLVSPSFTTPALGTPSAGTLTSCGGYTESIVVACSDESTTDLSVATGVVTFRMPYAFTLTAVRASVQTAPVGSTITVDINEGGTTILSTKITIDASEKTSTTAATPPVISDSALADDAEITIDIDQIGSSTAGKGLKVYLIGYHS